jgi:hypothetical protein
VRNRKTKIQLSIPKKYEKEFKDDEFYHSLLFLKKGQSEDTKEFINMLICEFDKAEVVEK